MGEPFANQIFLGLGSRQNIDTTLFRLIKKGVIERLRPGVYIRPKKGKYVESIKPELASIVQVIAMKNGEVVQFHGSEAARMLGFSTQMPMEPVYLTSGSSRSVPIQNVTVHFRHVSPVKLQNCNKPSGLALCALLHLGKTEVGKTEIQKVRKKLSIDEYKALKRLRMPEWLRTKLGSDE